MLKTGKGDARWAGASVHRRWFVSEGFLVEYFDGRREGGKPKGAFDLRAVVRVCPSTDDTAPPGAFDVVATGHGGKTRRYSFAPEGIVTKLELAAVWNWRLSLPTERPARGAASERWRASSRRRRAR